MNFSLQRCLCLARLQLAGNRRLYAYAVLALTGLLLAVMLYYVFYDKFGLYYSKQNMIFGVGWLLFTILAATWYFHNLTATATRLQALMLPVTAGEQLAVALFFNLIFIPRYI